MTFTEWVDREVAKQLAPVQVRDALVTEVRSMRKLLLEGVATTAGVSLRTVQTLYRGARTSRLDVAQAVSEATGGRVSVDSLTRAA